LCISRVLITSVWLSPRWTCCNLEELRNSTDNSLVQWHSHASGFTFHFLVLQVVILQSSANNTMFFDSYQSSSGPLWFDSHIVRILFIFISSDLFIYTCLNRITHYLNRITTLFLPKMLHLSSLHIYIDIYIYNHTTESTASTF
jgi:hypothetical protein